MFSIEIKQRAVEAAKTQLHTEVAKEFDLSPSTLTRWINESENGKLRGTFEGTYRSKAKTNGNHLPVVARPAEIHVPSQADDVMNFCPHCGVPLAALRKAINAIARR